MRPVIRDASRNDLPLLTELFRRSNDAPYDLAPVVEEKCFGRGFSGEPRIRIHEHGVAVTCGRYLRIRILAVDREHRGRGIGTALLRDSGAEVIAAEPGNYLTPGVWQQLGGFFEKLGYRQTGTTWNMHVNLAEARQRDAELTPAATLEPMLAFIAREFGPVWAFEAQRARAAFYIPDTGFAVIEANNRGLGTFGPFGVAKERRGQGHGATLVRAAMAELAQLGFAEAIVPWTDAISFYRKVCGAEPAHRFLTYTSRP
jgi:GNAT superfamily N-acetyltransferase